MESRRWGQVRLLGAVGVRVLVVAFTVGLATACQSDDGGRTSAFTSPDAAELTVGYDVTCPGDTASQRGELALGAEGFTPGTPVTLQWNVATRGINGSWGAVDADKDGLLQASVELEPGEIDPGDDVEVWAEGSSVEGILALSKVVPIGTC